MTTTFRIGVLGGGQLGRMMALAGYPLGMQLRFLDPSPQSPAGQVGELMVGGYDDHATLDRFAEGLDAITYEFENVPVEAARFLAERARIYPPPAALETSQDRVVEKKFFQAQGIPTAPFAPVNSRSELDAALEQLGMPSVLKTCRMGYDGKGQAMLRSSGDTEVAWDALGKQPLVLEGFVPFERELSIIGVRDRAGYSYFYPLVENHHRGGILRLSLAPAPGITPALQQTAEGYSLQVMEALGYVGVLAIELFQVGESLVANEMAPRVHNSGHWTIEGAETSQFENHMRAVAGLPLGSTATVGHAAMLNLIGTTPDIEDVLSVPGAHLHLYGKAPRPGRKLGHITLRADNASELEAGLERLQQIIGEDLFVE